MMKILRENGVINIKCSINDQLVGPFIAGRKYGSAVS